MKMTNREYNKYVADKAKPSPLWKDLCWAFFVGGGICAVGQGLTNLYVYLGATTEDAGAWTSITLIFVAALSELNVGFRVKHTAFHETLHVALSLLRAFSAFEQNNAVAVLCENKPAHKSRRSRSRYDDFFIRRAAFREFVRLFLYYARVLIFLHKLLFIVRFDVDRTDIVYIRFMPRVDGFF